MTDASASRASVRREAAKREILDAAWTLMAREGVAEISVREVARAVGMRQQSLIYYFPTKTALLDALFADGFADLARAFGRLPRNDDPVEAVVELAVGVVDFCVTNPARYHLMFQRTIPGFQPSEESHLVALGVLSGLTRRLAAAGVTAESDVALVRGLISGLAAEQSANDPSGRLFVDQTARGIRALVSATQARQGRAPDR